MQSARYPYTMAADFVRSLVMKDVDVIETTSITVPVMSRAQAAKIWHKLAQIWGLDEVECAMKLANAQQAVDMGEI